MRGRSTLPSRVRDNRTRMLLSNEVREFLLAGGRCLIVEDGEPKFVITSFREYLERLHGSRSVPDRRHSVLPRSPDDRRSLVESINRDIASLETGDHHPDQEGESPETFQTGSADGQRRHVFLAEEP